MRLAAGPLSEGDLVWEHPGLPLCLSPDRETDFEAVLREVSRGRAALTTELERHGALLFRDCSVRQVAQFDALMGALGMPAGDPDRYYGEVVRKRSSPWAHEPTRMPANLVISPHNELAFWYAQPAYVAFYCEHGAARGGQTPLIDCAAVAASLPAAIKRKLEHSVVENRYVYDSSEANGRLLRGQRRNSWQAAFGTTSPRAVERLLRERPEVGFRWRERGRLEVTVRTSPFAAHGALRATCLRALRAFDYESIDYMQRYLARAQMPPWTYWGTRLFTRSCVHAMKRGWLEHGRYAWHSQFCEGPPLSDAERSEVVACLFAHSTIFDWREGDVLVLDNVRTAHARLNVRGGRRLHVFMSALVDTDILLGQADLANEVGQGPQEGPSAPPLRSPVLEH